MFLARHLDCEDREIPFDLINGAGGFGKRPTVGGANKTQNATDQQREVPQNKFSGAQQEHFPTSASYNQPNITN